MPDYHWGIAMLAHLEGNVGVPAIEGGAVVNHSVIVEIHPGIDRGTAGPARRRLAEMPCKEQPVTRQPIQIGCQSGPVTERRKAIASPLVDIDQYDIRTAGS